MEVDIYLREMKRARARESNENDEKNTTNQA